MDYISPAAGVKPELYMEVTSRDFNNLSYFNKFFGGKIYFDRANNSFYKWRLDGSASMATAPARTGGSAVLLRERSRGDSFTAFIHYLKLCPIQSTKRNRLFLIKKFNSLINY